MALAVALLVLIATPVLDETTIAAPFETIAVIDGNTIDAKLLFGVTENGTLEEIPKFARLRLVSIEPHKKKAPQILEDIVGKSAIAVFSMATLNGRRYPITDKNGYIYAVIVTDPEKYETANRTLVKKGVAKIKHLKLTPKLTHLSQKYVE